MSKLADLGALVFARVARPGTVVGAAFLATGAAIATNALFLQPRPHPAPLFSTRVSTREADARTAPRSDELVLAVQEALKDQALYSGPLDGIPGPLTASAIQTFERSAGRAETGEASVGLLAAIRASRAPAQTAGVPAPEVQDVPEPGRHVEPPQPDPLVAAVQNALALSAYGPLIADGVIGPETRAAIMRFERDHNLPVTGEISDGLVVELRAIGAMQDG